MDEESAFQAALDANPDDFVCRLVFADYLEERGDERARGYRALAAQRLTPESFGACAHPISWWNAGMGYITHALPADWFAAMEKPERRYEHTDAEFDFYHEAEDAAARAFARLPAARQAELLNPAPVPTPNQEATT